MAEPYETKTKSGKLEERIYVDSGKFIRYSYKDKTTGKITKDKIILLGNNQMAYFLIPAGNKELAIKAEFDLNASVKEGDSIKKLIDLLSEI
ncbi:MAG: hypothetical protein RE471_05470 [Ferroplasma sp.]|uniref:hypothetical protein n=1 Tax=Ferroplasma sp. TaxID=2591003 RepID=UPI002814FD42|nr:hypothetical protein [Ferroplasma sp.]WMT50431.1 MAG: hypothetical protein RE471_05470 [Ferroplasma sp.]